LAGETGMSALFGHRKGAFPRANQPANGYIGESDGGCLFLDEVQTLTVDCQQRLLRQEIVKLQLPGPTIIKTILPPTPIRRIISP